MKKIKIRTIFFTLKLLYYVLNYTEKNFTIIKYNFKNVHFFKECANYILFYVLLEIFFQKFHLNISCLLIMVKIDCFICGKKYLFFFKINVRIFKVNVSNFYKINKMYFEYLK